jgi:hypothetical protein
VSRLQVDRARPDAWAVGAEMREMRERRAVGRSGSGSGEGRAQPEQEKGAAHDEQASAHSGAY